MSLSAFLEIPATKSQPLFKTTHLLAEKGGCGDQDCKIHPGIRFADNHRKHDPFLTRKCKMVSCENGRVLDN